MLKPGLENFEHYFASVWEECNCAVVWTELGKQTFRGHKQNLVHTRTQVKGAVTPQEKDPEFPMSVQEFPVEAWVGSGLLQGWGHWVCAWGLLKEVAIIFVTSTLRPSFGLKSNNREGTHPHPSIENWFKDLLNMALPIRTGPSCPHN